MRKRITSRARRVVVKVGSAVLVKRRGVFRALAGEMKALRDGGRDGVVVSSGAIALGMEALGLNKRPRSIPEFQAVAAAGQLNLMFRYKRAFSSFDTRIGQVLLTHDDFSDRTRFLNARNTLMTLFKLGIVPIVNENDTVAVDEIKFGDNDILSAMATNLVEADLLLMLTDIDGLYDRDPRQEPAAKKIPLVRDVDEIDLCWLGPPRPGSFGTGGMASKVGAARMAAHFGAATIVASGFTEGVITRALAGEELGTLFLPKENKLTSKKHWIAFSTRPTGKIIVDNGAKRAIAVLKKSLLPSGVKAVEGVFRAGEPVHCVDSEGMEFARGLVNYSSDELERIKGARTSEIERILGYKVYDEVIHRDNLVVII